MYAIIKPVKYRLYLGGNMCIYLVDYENVNYAGIEGIAGLEAEDIVYIFYNEQIKTMPFSAGVDLAKAKARTEFISIKKTGKNYLDFQLATLLGYFIGKNESIKAVIISNDTGFDSVVDFWKSKNADVCRKSSISKKKSETKPAALKQAAEKTTPAPKEKAAEKSDDSKQAAGKTAPAQKEKAAKEQKTKAAADKKTTKKKSASTADFTEEYRKKLRSAVKGEEIAAKSYTLIYKAIVESKDKAKLNTALVKSFGSEKGNRIYRLIKKIFDEFCKSVQA